MRNAPRGGGALATDDLDRNVEPSVTPAHPHKTEPRARKGVVRTTIDRGALCVCLCCDASWDGRLAFILCTDHVRDTGHQVTAEQVARYLYGPAAEGGGRG